MTDFQSPNFRRPVRTGHEKPRNTAFKSGLPPPVNMTKSYHAPVRGPTPAPFRLGKRKADVIDLDCPEWNSFEGPPSPHQDQSGFRQTEEEYNPYHDDRRKTTAEREAQKRRRQELLQLQQKRDAKNKKWVSWGATPSAEQKHNPVSIKKKGSVPLKVRFDEAPQTSSTTTKKGLVPLKVRFDEAPQTSSTTTKKSSAPPATNTKTQTSAPVDPARRPVKQIKSAENPQEKELRDSVTKVLTAAPPPPPKSIWSQDFEFEHSDNELSDSEHLNLPSHSTQSPSPTTITTQRTRVHNPLDPGIMRAPGTTDPTRSVLRYDPSQPRPAHAKTPTFGSLPGLYIGKKWHSRIGASWDGTHVAVVAGISGRTGEGVWSIALSGGYEDDIDEGYRFLYTGSGGRDTPGQEKTGFRVGKGQQSKNQDWNKSNSALRENVHNEKPVRVIRGYKGDSVWSPKEGFMYSGLYEVVACWVEQGKSGFDVIRFAFKRLRDQPPLVDGEGEVMPEPNYDSEEWKGWEARLTAERAEEVLDIKKEESPAPETQRRVQKVAPKDTYIKVEQDLNNVWRNFIHNTDV